MEGPIETSALFEARAAPHRSAAVTSLLLTRLHHEGMVNTRREGKLIYYSPSDPRAAKVIACTCETFRG